MFTRGGAAKRIFKPTIPTTRRSTRSGEKDGDQNNSCNTSTPHGKVKSKDKERPNKSKGKKELIQLDATFNGINIAASSVKAERGSFVNSGSSNINYLKDRAIKSEDSDVKSINGIRIKSEDDSVPNGHIRNADDAKDVRKHENDDAETIQRALYRDDFVSNYSTNDDELAPIGWEHVSQLQLYKHKDCEKDVKPSTRFDNWASTKSQQDKMVLFQLPEMVLKGGDGKLGKIRMYKSGKMELVDTRSGIVYDLLHTDCDVNHQLAGKDDGNSSEEETDNDEVMNELNEKQKSSSTDWIKKEVEEESANNQDTLPHLPSSSKSQSIHSKNMHKNYRDKCDKDEDTEDDDDDDDDDDREMNQSYREAVTFDGNQLVCLGPISKNDLLIGRPRLDKYFNL